MSATATLLARLEADDLARNAANQRSYPRAPAGAGASRSDLRVGPSSLGTHAGLGLFAGASPIPAKSRISQYRGALLPPDDQLFRGLIVKFCADRQMSVDEPLVSYLTSRIERSYAAVRQAVELLDTEALRLGRPVTRALAAELLRDA